MAAVSKAVLAAFTGVSPRKQRDYSYLKPYQFKPGHPPYQRADGTQGRAVGCKDAATIYLESLPLKARQWVKSTDAKILSEARQLVAKSAPELSLDSSLVNVNIIVSTVEGLKEIAARRQARLTQNTVAADGILDAG